LWGAAVKKTYQGRGDGFKKKFEVVGRQVRTVESPLPKVEV